jgi:hypothetical protein
VSARKKARTNSDRPGHLYRHPHPPKLAALDRDPQVVSIELSTRRRPTDS